MGDAVTSASWLEVFDKASSGKAGGQPALIHGQWPKIKVSALFRSRMGTKVLLTNRQRVPRHRKDALERGIYAEPSVSSNKSKAVDSNDSDGDDSTLVI